MKYGLNYQGSKNALAAELCDVFPIKTNFYDLFAGGGAITHRMLEKGGFVRYFCSDINDMVVGLFSECYYGDVPAIHWINREEFNMFKQDDAYTACLYSFGGDWSSYLYSKEKEPIQEALHDAVVRLDFTKARQHKLDIEFISVFNSWQARRLALLPEGKRLIELERYEQLVAISKLPVRDVVTFACGSYDDAEILPDSVIYCDPPYKDTKGYVAGGFNHEKFYDWCRSQKELTFISEYTMPDDFILIREFPRLEAKSAYKSTLVTERLFIPGHQRELYEDNKTTLF